MPAAAPWTLVNDTTPQPDCPYCVINSREGGPGYQHRHWQPGQTPPAPAPARREPGWFWRVLFRVYGG